MLRSITIDGFRAFKHEHIETTQLNIFVGPNNSGKSSLISAIALIAQNVKRGTQEFSLALNGAYADLGTFYDTVHGHSAKSHLHLAFEIDEFKYSYKFRYRSQRREIELVKAEIKFRNLQYDYITTKDSAKESIKRDGKSVKLNAKFKSRFYGLFIVAPLGSVYYGGMEGEDFAEVSKVRNFMYSAMNKLERSFADFDYVGAFRAAPERTYHYTGEAPLSVGRSGQNFAQMLASSASSRSKGDILVGKSVSQWFSDSGVARNVEVRPLTNRHFEIIIEDHTGARNNLIDSGFGCSQVLPVLAGGYSLIRNFSRNRPPIYVVQEPEIHLHPSAAAHLGTYFVDLANTGVQCFVETHSENIVLRVAKHVADGRIKADDVAIYWVSGSSGVNSAMRMRIRPDGTFEKEWPEGFFPTRASETLALARASTSVRRSQNSGDQ